MRAALKISMAVNGGNGGDLATELFSQSDLDGWSEAV
jgi:hypothetical protein